MLDDLDDLALTVRNRRVILFADAGDLMVVGLPSWQTLIGYMQEEFGRKTDVKFRVDAMGRTMLFIGYSMQDLNIRLLLYRIWETWKQSGYGRERPKSYVFMPALDPVQEAVLDRWGITLVTDPAEALQGFLGHLRVRVDQVDAEGCHGDEEGSGDQVQLQGLIVKPSPSTGAAGGLHGNGGRSSGL